MVIKNRSKVCLIISAAIIIVALFLTFIGHGINLGIDFAGGLSMQYKLTESAKVDKATVEKVLDSMSLSSYTVTVQGASGNEVNIRIKDATEDNKQDIKSEFEEKIKNNEQITFIVNGGN